MRIAIPLDENRKDVCIVFARAPYFLIRDGKEDIVLENPAASAHGGAGLQAAQFLVDQGVNALITVRCGENAAEVFGAAEIKVYKSEGADAAENLAAMEEGKLSELTEFHSGYHGIR